MHLNMAFTSLYSMRAFSFSNTNLSSLISLITVILSVTFLIRQFCLKIGPNYLVFLSLTHFNNFVSLLFPISSCFLPFQFIIFSILSYLFTFQSFPYNLPLYIQWSKSLFYTVPCSRQIPLIIFFLMQHSISQ